MSKKIVAIGGGLNGRRKEDGTYEPYETGPIDREIIKITGIDKPNFLFLAHAQPKEQIQDEYFMTMRNIYEGIYGCECRHLKTKDLVNYEKVLSLIEWADIIYEGGGNTLEMITLWKQTGFDKVLRNAWEKGKVMCGVSAGANCWFKECLSNSLQMKYGNDKPLIRMDCIGLIDGLFVPHCDDSGRAESVKDLLKTSSQIGLLISGCCALEIIDDEYRLINGTPIEYEMKPYGLKSFWQNKEYIVENIDEGLQYKPLSKLFSRNVKHK